jgi:hypothetical protein
MAMSADVLATQLLSLVPVETEAQAIVALTDAYGVFAADAVAGVAPITVAGVVLGQAAMRAALVGMSAPGAAPAVLVAATQAFWGAVAGGLAVSFLGAIAIVPPPHVGLQALLTLTFSTNTTTSASQVVATNAVAGDFYNQAIIGGSVTFPGPVVSLIL